MAWTSKRRIDGGLRLRREPLRTEKLQRLGLRSGNGIAACILAISAARAAALSLGGGGPDSLLARAFKTCGGMVPALTSTGSKPPAASTVLHSCGSFAIVRELRGSPKGFGLKLSTSANRPVVPFAAAAVAIGSVGADVVAPPARRRGAGSRGVFPLGFRRQTIGIRRMVEGWVGGANLVVQP